MKNTLSYCELSRKVNKHYSKVLKEYPLSRYYLDTELRVMYTNPLLQKYNFQRYNYSQYFKIFFFKIYYLVLSVFLQFHKKNSKKSKVFLSVNRHRDLQSLLKYSLSQLGIEVIQNAPSKISLLTFQRYLALGHIAANSYMLQGIHMKMKRKGLPKFLSQYKNIQKLEVALQKQIKFTESFLINLKIERLIIQNEHCFHEKILMAAAKNVVVPVIVIAHGYVQCSALAAIAPIEANYLIVWTEAQKNYIENQSNEFLGKVKFFGWPFERITSSSSTKHISPLIILTDVDDVLTDYQFERTLNFLDGFTKRCKTARIRLHPTTIRVTSKRNTLLTERYTSYLSELDLTEDLQRSNLVIGHDSSVLVTAIENGIETYRFTETAISNIPEVPVLTMRQVLNRLDVGYTREVIARQNTQQLVHVADQIVNLLT